MWSHLTMISCPPLTSCSKPTKSHWRCALFIIFAIVRASPSSKPDAIIIAMNMKEPQVTKNTLKDLYAVMDNKKAMQVLLEAKDAKDVIEYLKA